MQDLWIVGGSGAALEVWAVARAMEAAGPQPWKVRGFLVINGSLEFNPEGLEVQDESTFLAAPPASSALIVLGLGEPSLREKVAQVYASKGFRFATLIHPSAIIGPACSVGEGSVLMAQAVLETHVKVGEHALLNVGSSIAHNGSLGACCSLGPGVRLAGWVTLGNRCDLGVGSCVRPRVTLGPDTRVGAGAAIVADHPGSATLVGVPAVPRPAS
ncbi:MAG: acetyltransferase [Geothrix sp.]|uniref:acetyltransferase n=1 Tax=Geothrix sp. TaxID=1962974 RepID=UPI00184A32F9|nr:acetyltransferase [Geothrix sp.]NWJ39797.1 acetyltransferase [Geothrix sp.]WIL22190.1 MAG: acetyltransferase [Geothrix sp.]